MIKKQLQARPNWQETVESQGFYFHTIEGKTYWDENACYQITEKEANILERATNELHALCLNAVEVAIQRGYLRAVAHSGVVHSTN